jgi:hypothetical protein
MDQSREGGLAKPVFVVNPVTVYLAAGPTIDIGDVTLLPSEAHIGAVGGNAFGVDVTPTLSVAATYVANDYVGTNNVAMVFPNCARLNGGFGWITRALLVVSIVDTVALELWLFDTAPTGLGLDSAAFTITDADAARCVGVIPFQTFYTSALNSVAGGYMPNGPMGFQCLPGSRDLYGAFKTNGAPAYVGNNLTSRLIGIQY